MARTLRDSCTPLAALLYFGEDLLQEPGGLERLLGGQDEGRVDADAGRVGHGDDPSLEGSPEDRLASSPRQRLAGLLVSHQLEADEQALAADLPDEGEPVDPRGQGVEEDLADAARVLHQILFDD